MWKLAVLPPFGWLIAQQPPPGGAEVIGWLNYGVLGLLVLGFITGRIRTDGAVREAQALYQQERVRAEATQAQVVDVLERHLPVLTAAAATWRDGLDLIHEATEQLQTLLVEARR